MRLPLLSGLLAAVLLAACGPTAGSPPRATPTPTPLPPDTQVVDIAAEGVGTFDLVAMPVAVIRNLATRHSAQQVRVTFQTKRAAQKLGSLSAVPVILEPGETMIVAADCTESCTGADAVDVSVRVGTWSSAVSGPLRAGTAVYGCGSCGPGHGYGTVSGALLTSESRNSGSVTAFAACFDAGGAIIGGGEQQLSWSGGSSMPAEVPVIVSSPPTRCQLSASATW